MKVRQYNAEGVYLRTHESIGEAAKAVHTYWGNISNAIKLEIKSKGYYWMKDEGPRKLKIKIRHYRRGGKHILVFKNGKYLCETITMSEAEDITGIPESTIRNSCKGKKLTNKTYSFKYKNNSSEIK
jgi:hypothetical protein